jgi:hypothetical protein
MSIGIVAASFSTFAMCARMYASAESSGGYFRENA